MSVTRRSAAQRAAGSSHGPETAQDQAVEGLEHALLGLLRLRPMHAYEMHQQLAHAADGQALGHVWRLKQSHLYALLAKLEAVGYLAGTIEPQGTRPPRRVLRLTPAGETAFAEWVVAPVRHGRDFRLDFLAKLFFAEREGGATVATLLARQRQACESWLATLRAHAAEVEDPRRFDQLVALFRISQIEAILGWLDQCAATSDTPSKE